MTSRREYEEKRNFIRMKVDAQVEITPAGGSTINGVCRNLSGAGLLAETADPIALDTAVVVHIPAAGTKAPSFRAEGTVARLDTLEKGFMLGINITKVLD